MYQAVSDTTWTYDANDQVNGSGVDFVSYAWTSVPGYSAFGKYTANGSANGPFIYLGFMPALVIVRKLDQLMEAGRCMTQLEVHTIQIL